MIKILQKKNPTTFYSQAQQPKLGKLNSRITKNSHPVATGMEIFTCKLSHRSITCSKLNIINKMGSNFLFSQWPGQLYWQFLLDQKLTFPTN